MTKSEYILNKISELRKSNPELLIKILKIEGKKMMKLPNTQLSPVETKKMLKVKNLVRGSKKY